MNETNTKSNTARPLQARATGTTGGLRVVAILREVSTAERRCVALFFSYVFLLLVCYYILKTLREPLLLDHGSAELKSYAYACVAFVLLFLVPLYGVAVRRIRRCRMSLCVTAFFLAVLGIFIAAGRAGFDIGFAYYVWVGIFGVTMVAQFWASASDLLNAASGRRLFPVIMAGAALGALAGPPLVGLLYAFLGPWMLMLVAAAMLAATIPLLAWTCNAIPESARNALPEPGKATGPLGGFALVLRDRYLLLLALLVVLLNCVNTMGDFLLTDLVVTRSDLQAAADPALDKDALIAAFYGNFYLVVNLLTFIAQLFLAGRLLRWIGTSGTLLVLPVIVIAGYGLIMFLPIFAVLQALKLFENSADYSIMNTARQTLYLHLPQAAKFEGKMAIDTFFCRLGDLLQAGLVFVGINLLHFGLQQFALLNTLLAAAWFTVAFALARRHSAQTRQTAVAQPKAASGETSGAAALAG